jgi:hypothetical protein
MVDLSLVGNCFCYIYERNKNIIYKASKVIFKFKQYDYQVDNCIVNYKHGKNHIYLTKNTKSGNYQLDFNIKKLSIKLNANFSLKNNPLKVVNPIDLEH